MVSERQGQLLETTELGRLPYTFSDGQVPAIQLLACYSQCVLESRALVSPESLLGMQTVWSHLRPIPDRICISARHLGDLYSSESLRSMVLPHWILNLGHFDGFGQIFHPNVLLPFSI